MFIFDFCIHFDYISFVFHDYDDEHPAGATGRKGVLTPPHHMIPPLSFIIPLSCLLCFEFVFRYMNFWDDLQLVIVIFHIGLTNLIQDLVNVALSSDVVERHMLVFKSNNIRVDNFAKIYKKKMKNYKIKIKDCKFYFLFFEMNIFRVFLMLKLLIYIICSALKSFIILFQIR